MQRPLFFSWIAACSLLACAGWPACAQQTPPAAGQPSFVHPGIPFTKSDLDTLKANLDKYPWKAGFEALKADGHSSLDYKMQGPFEEVSRNPHRNRNQWMNDMRAVYNLSRMWYFTGNAAYAQKAHDILLAWAKTQKSFVGIESNLDLGDFAICYAGGAEILRSSWPGWTQADTDAVRALFDNVYWPASGAGNASIGPANKGMLTLVAGGAMAVFNDDRAKFEHVLYLYRTNTTGALRNTLPIGEIGESGRDQGHAYGTFLSMAVLSEICWRQGIDLYSERDNRLMAIGEYYGRTNLHLPTPFVTFGPSDALYWNAAEAGWSGGRMGLDILYSAYVIRRGLTAPYLDQRREQLSIDQDSFMYMKEKDGSTATPLPALAFPQTALVSKGLISHDIGDAAPAGSSVLKDGTWTVQGGGGEIWTHDNDSGHFVYQSVTGDGAVLAKVEALEAGDGHAKAGVMLRDSLEPNAQRAWVAITPAKTAEFFLHGWTEMYGGSNWEKKSRDIPQMPYWVKVERRGETVTAYCSPDGTSWATLGSGKFGNLGRNLYLGLTVCSMKNGTSMTAKFSQVSLTGGDGLAKAAVPEAPLAVLASPGNNQVPLRWLESFGATGYRVKRSLTSGGPYSPVATVAGTSCVDGTAKNGARYYYVVTAVNAAGESPNSKEDSVAPLAPQINIALGGTATSATNSGMATGDGSSPEGPDKAFDQNAGTKWYTGGDTGTTGWLEYAFPAGTRRTVQSYRLTSANDVPGRDPKDWQLLGSNDGTNWTTLDARIGQQFSDRFQALSYTIASPAAYRFYRLNITAIADPVANSIQLAELALKGVVP